MWACRSKCDNTHIGACIGLLLSTCFRLLMLPGCMSRYVSVGVSVGLADTRGLKVPWGYVCNHWRFMNLAVCIQHHIRKSESLFHPEAAINRPTTSILIIIGWTDEFSITHFQMFSPRWRKPITINKWRWRSLRAEESCLKAPVKATLNYIYILATENVYATTKLNNIIITQLSVSASVTGMMPYRYSCNHSLI